MNQACELSEMINPICRVVYWDNCANNLGCADKGGQIIRAPLYPSMCACAIAHEIKVEFGVTFIPVQLLAVSSDWTNTKKVTPNIVKSKMKKFL